MRGEAGGLGLLKTTQRPFRMDLGVVCVSAAPSMTAWWALRPGRFGAFRSRHVLNTLCTELRIQFYLTAI